MTSTPFFVGGVKVGFLERDGWYYSRRGPQHYCVKHQGWGVQRAILDELKERKALGVCIVSTSTGVKYYGKMELWDRFGVPDELSEPHGRQVFLHKNHFKINITREE